MTNLNVAQETALRDFESAYGRLADAKRHLASVYAERLAIELLTLRVDASRAGNAAVAAGVPITKLGDKARGGMQTKSFATIREFLDLTSHVPIGERAA